MQKLWAKWLRRSNPVWDSYTALISGFPVQEDLPITNAGKINVLVN